MRILLAILLFPLVVQAAGEGMWQASSVGVTLNHRGESMSSAPLSSRQPVSGLMTLVAWRYQLIGPTPVGLRVRLCSQSRCVELDGQSGTTVAFSGIPAAESLRFIWEVPGGGRLIPPLKVQRNEVIVNYRQ
ncbi:flagellar protein FlhE [Escherichia coli]|uniref:flagellar protein FlhE n=1 Tax=Escherichia coli TaxID=562 RepID=UPI0018040349|nr:flagellar protein FlhE [Escherichia coli]EII9937409.1 flagellar protein FlhE [Escherichia coli]EKE4263953.1 flagellar protein FlhE [Escherichia coli]